MAFEAFEVLFANTHTCNPIAFPISPAFEFEFQWVEGQK